MNAEKDRKTTYGDKNQWKQKYLFHFRSFLV